MNPALTTSVVATATFLLASVGYANGLVNKDSPPRVQNTPSLALNPTFTQQMCAAYVDDPGALNGIGTSFSIDGGITWIDSYTPIPSIIGNEYDPSLVFDPAGSVLVGFCTYDALIPSQSGIMCAFSFDGGQNFALPAPIFMGTGPMGTIPFEVKPKLELDDHPTSPYMGTVYGIWERDLTNWINSQACFSWAPAVGAPWTAPPTVLNDAPAGAWLTLWPDLAVGPDGRVFGGWLDTPYWMQHQGAIYVDSSPDAGMTWGRDVPAVTFWAVPQTFTDVTGIPTYTAMSYPSIEVDPSNPLRVCVVYAADPDDGTTMETRIDRGDQPPGTADVQFLHPFNGATQMAAENGWVHTVWVDYRAGYGDVYACRSQTGIATWPYPDVLLSTLAPPLHTGSNNANVATSGNDVYVVWDEWNGVDFANLIFLNRSADNGQTWLPTPLALDHQGRTAAQPIVVSSGSNVCVVWEAFSTTGVREIRSNRSIDRGVTWLNPEIRLPTPAGVDAFWPHVASSGSMVHAVWYEDAGGGNSDVYASRSTDAGLTWSTPTRLNQPIPTIRFGPKVACTPTGQVYVTWVDKRVNGVENPYFTMSPDFGLSWTPDVRINVGVATPGTTIDRDSQIACNGSDVYVVYTSDRLGTVGAGPTDAFCAHSADGGMTWTDTRLDTGDSGGQWFAALPRISVDGTYVYVVWQDDRNSPTPLGTFDIYGTYSVDGGATWLVPDYRIDMGDPPGSSSSTTPHVASDYTGPYYGWEDDRRGQGDVYVNQYRTGPDQGDIFFIESLDAGLTWSNPLRVNDDVGTNDQCKPWLDIKPAGTVDVVWYDTRMDPNDRILDVFFAAYQPGAPAFTANVPLNTAPIVPPPFPAPGLGDYIWVDVDTTMAHVVWTDTRRPADAGLGDIYYVAVENPEPLGADSGGSSSEMPSLPYLHAASPNPFRADAELTFLLPERMHVRVSIYDAVARHVVTLVEEPRDAGTQTVRWDGCNQSGARVSPGVYFSRLEAGGVVRVRKIVLVK